MKTTLNLPQSGLKKALIKGTLGLILLAGCGASSEDRHSDSEALSPSIATSTTSAFPTPEEVKEFRQWFKINTAPISGSSHGFVDIYFNQPFERLADRQGKIFYPFPEGTIVTKVILDTGGLSLMRKKKGSNPTHNDWQFIEYDGKGQIVGKDEACWGCHANAKLQDYVFVNVENADKPIQFW